MTREKCRINGEEYEHGAEVCTDKKCQVCVDGKWEAADMIKTRRGGLTIAPGKDLSDI